MDDGCGGGCGGDDDDVLLELNPSARRAGWMPSWEADDGGCKCGGSCSNEGKDLGGLVDFPEIAGLLFTTVVGEQKRSRQTGGRGGNLGRQDRPPRKVKKNDNAEDEAEPVKVESNEVVVVDGSDGSDVVIVSGSAPYIDMGEWGFLFGTHTDDISGFHVGGDRGGGGSVGATQEAGEDESVEQAFLQVLLLAIATAELLEVVGFSLVIGGLGTLVIVSAIDAELDVPYGSSYMCEATCFVLPKRGCKDEVAHALGGTMQEACDNAERFATALIKRGCDLDFCSRTVVGGG
jgi:hypothetical protein